jgi:hypothetical protein
VTPKSQTLRRAALVVGSATLLTFAYAGPASADVPIGWSHPSSVSAVTFLLLFIGIPALITLGIVAGVYLPGIVRGESVAPAGSRTEDQWFGGRRELEAPEREREGDTGGASGTW